MVKKLFHFFILLTLYISNLLPGAQPSPSKKALPTTSSGPHTAAPAGQSHPSASRRALIRKRKEAREDETNQHAALTEARISALEDAVLSINNVQVRMHQSIVAMVTVLNQLTEKSSKLQADNHSPRSPESPLSSAPPSPRRAATRSFPATHEPSRATPPGSSSYKAAASPAAPPAHLSSPTPYIRDSTRLTVAHNKSQAARFTSRASALDEEEWPALEL